VIAPTSTTLVVPAGAGTGDASPLGRMLNGLLQSGQPNPTTPSTITSGQLTTLSWSVSGASSVSVDNGVGDVSNVTSTSVAPANTTTYTLTATNSDGSVTAHAMVTVIAAVDTQPPTVPTIVSAVASSATEVDLNWTASTDNVGVSGYQVIRNSVAIASVSGASLSYADTTVSSNTTYTYCIKADDGAGNYSGPSNGVVVTTPAMAVAGTCPAPATNAFTGCYYNNINLSGNPVFVRTDSQINFYWGSGSPASSLAGGNFSVRWQGTFSFEQGDYIFSTIAAGGVRMYIDGGIILNWWMDRQAPSMYNVEQTISQGSHLITVEYYAQNSSATANMSWRRN